MADFQRSFDIRPNGDHRLLDDLLALWKPAGVKADSDAGEWGLRLAVRNKYLNFYSEGQSIALINYDRKGDLSAKVHGKYIDDKQTGQDYKKILSTDYLDSNQVKTWIKSSEKYRGEEKNSLIR